MNLSACLDAHRACASAVSHDQRTLAERMFANAAGALRGKTVPAPQVIVVDDEDFSDGVHAAGETLRHVAACLAKAQADDRSLTRGGHEPEEWDAARRDAERRLLSVTLDLIGICAEAVARPDGRRLMRQVVDMAAENLEGRP